MVKGMVVWQSMSQGSCAPCLKLVIPSGWVGRGAFAVDLDFTFRGGSVTLSVEYF